jgi:hypothetical protein
VKGCLASFPSYRGRRFLATIFLDFGDADSCALGGKASRIRAAKAPARACNDHDFVSVPVHPVFVLAHALL